MNWQAPHALEVLGSPEHGFFLWTPLAALALAGLVVLVVRGQTQARRIAACALLMVAVQIYVSGSVESWTVAGAFGQRRFVALTILLTIGLAALIAALARTRWRPALGAMIGALRVVERRPHRRVRHRADEPAAARTAPERVRCVRDAAAAAAGARLPLLPRSGLLLPSEGALTCEILYFADIRFPLERANGIQTMETCHALAGRGHEVHLVVRPDTHTPARDPFGTTACPAPPA